MKNGENSFVPTSSSQVAYVNRRDQRVFHPPVGGLREMDVVYAFAAINDMKRQAFHFDAD